MSHEEPRRRDPATVRIATWSARHRWPVFVLWFVATIGLFALGTAMGGTRTESATGNTEQRTRSESRQAYDVFNASGEQEASQQLFLIVSATSGKITDPVNAANVDAAVTRLQQLPATVAGANVATFSEVIHPLRVPPAAGLVSPDGTTARIVGRVLGEGSVLRQKLDPVPPAVEELRTAAGGTVSYHVLNNSLINEEISEVVNTDLDGSLRLTIPLTFGILLVAFGAIVAAVVPLVLAITALVAAFGLMAIYSQLIDPVSPYASQLIVLIGLAVAVDYSLFMLTRFRSERRRGRDTQGAIAVASSTAGRAVFFSGLAVMISIAGLFLLNEPIFQSMAIGTISVVLISVIGSLTFLPATLAILGRGVDWGRLPIVGRSREEGSGLWSRVVMGVMRRPVIAAGLVTALLLALASPVTRLHLGQSDLTAFPQGLEGVKALNLMNEKWPQGSTLELQVAVTAADSPETQAAIERLRAETLRIPGVGEPVRTSLSQDKTVAMISFVLAGGQNDVANHDIVRRVRAETVPAVFGGLPDVKAYVAGDAAYAMDVTQRYVDGMPLVFAFVLSLSFLILLVAFRSIVIPIKAILLNLLATGVTYGVLVLVFQEGWFSEQLGIRPGIIESFVPVMIFTILFGLSMDYHLFILTRIKEARDRGLPSNEAVARGISITSGTITSAAAIMVVVFAVFVTLQLVIIRQLGLGLAVAVFVDATIIRSVLLPASMRLLGDWNWYLPPFLRWLPHVTIEGEPEDDAPASAPGHESGREPTPASA